MRKEDEQAMRRTIALLKMKCQEQKECPRCPLYTEYIADNYRHHGCLLDVPPAYLDADAVIECFT